MILSVFNECLSQGIFPKVLKIGKIVPLHKKGDLAEVGNYRPVCILPILSKVLETSLKNRIVHFFESNQLFTEAQFGFRKGKSTVMAIRKVIDFVLDSMDKSQKCCSIFCDLSKAFDCLRHDVLLLKLSYYGFKDGEHNMLKSYLNDRDQVVKVNNIYSNKETSAIGVPQGSILGPLLFLIYINDLAECLPDWALITLFADDTHVGITDRNDALVKDKEIEIIEKLKLWFEGNGIILNADKNVIIKYKVRKDKNLLSVKETTFLGYDLDYTITHENHINRVCKKLSSANYALFKLKPVVDKNTLISVYYAYCHSIISYAITVWGNASEIERVLICQKRSIRIINGLYVRQSARDSFKSNKIMTVISLFIYTSLLEIHSQKDQLTMRMDGHKYNTRNKEKLQVPMTRLNKTYKQGRSLKIDMYNKLPLDLTKLTILEFKTKTKAFFKTHPFLL